MNENKTAITEMREWLEGQFERDRINATYKNAIHDCLLTARALESSQTEKDKGLREMLYKKLYPYPCGESNNRVRLDGSSLDIWFTKDEVDLIISRHQSNPIDPDYAEFKAWKVPAPKPEANPRHECVQGGIDEMYSGEAKPATLEPLALEELARRTGFYMCKLTDIFLSKDPADKSPKHFISEVQARTWLEEQEDKK